MLGAAACGGSGSEPTGTPVNPIVSGRFDLVTYDAKPLPDTLRVIVGVSSTPGSSASVSCPEILRSATLDVGPADDIAPTFTRTSRIAYPCTGTLPRPSDLPDSTTRVELGHVRDLGSTIELSFDAFQDTTFVELAEFGHVTGGDIVIDRLLIPGPPPGGTSESLPNARVYRHE